MSTFRGALSRQHGPTHARQHGSHAIVGTNTDIAGGTASLSVLQAITRALTETAGGTDSASSQFGAVESITDTAGGTDSASGGVTLARPTVDRANGYDFLVGLPTGGRAFRTGRSRQHGGDRQHGARTVVRAEYAGGHDHLAVVLARVVTPALPDAANGTDAAYATPTVTTTLIDAAYGRETLTAAPTRPRSTTDTAGGTDTVSVVRQTRRTPTDIAGGRDRVATGLGPRYRLSDAYPLSQVWGEDIRGKVRADHTDPGVDMWPKRADGTQPAYVNDTVGTISPTPTPTALQMAGGDLGFFCPLSDGRKLMVAGDNMGPLSPTGYIRPHPSVGVTGFFGQWLYYRPSACAITSTTGAQIESTGIVIDGWHRQFAVANPGGGGRVFSVAPLQTDSIVYSGAPPNRYATYPQRYYAYGDGVSIPFGGMLGGATAIYPMVTSPSIGVGFLTANESNLAAWTHTVVWGTSVAKPLGAASLNIADANGIPPADYTTLVNDIHSGQNTFYAYLHANASDGKGFYVARFNLQLGQGVVQFGDPTRWSWWNGTSWVLDGLASAQLQVATSNLHNFLSAGFSIRYHPTFNGGGWLLLYVGGTGTASLGGGNRLTYRTAPAPWGPWSAERWISGWDGNTATGPNVDSPLYLYQPNIWPDVDDPAKLYFTFSLGGDFTAPEPTTHSFVDDGTGHCQRWRTHITQTFAHTNANIGCGLTLSDHNALQAAYTAGTETPGNGYSVPYAVFVGEMALTSTEQWTDTEIEQANGTDTTTARIPTSIRSLADAARGVDVARGFLGVGVTFDTAGGTDSTSAQMAVTQTATDAAGGTDTVEGEFVVPTLTDTAGGTDTVAAQVGLDGEIADAAGGVDDVSTSGAYTRDLTETAAGSDNATGGATFIRPVTDQAAGVDTLTVSGAFSRLLTDAAVGADSASTSAAFARTITDQASGADSVSVSTAHSRSLTDAAAGVGSVSVSGAYSRGVTDSARAQDHAIAVLARRGDVVPVHWTERSTVSYVENRTDIGTVERSVARYTEPRSGLDGDDESALLT